MRFALPLLLAIAVELSAATIKPDVFEPATTARLKIASSGDSGLVDPAIGSGQWRRDERRLDDNRQGLVRFGFGFGSC